MKRESTGNAIVDLSFDFASHILIFAEELLLQRRFVVEHQLCKSGTSIGANVREAQNAESKDDFIHKMKIAAKEADETKYWLELCKYTPNYPFHQELLDEVDVILRILNTILGSTRKGAKQ